MAQKIDDLKSDRRGLSRSLTNLRQRTEVLLDYLEDKIEPNLQTRALSEFRKQVKEVRRLL